MFFPKELSLICYFKKHYKSPAFKERLAKKRLKLLEFDKFTNWILNAVGFFHLWRTLDLN